MTEPTPAEREAAKNIVRFELKLKAAPEGSLLAANLRLRIARTKAAFAKDAASCAMLDLDAVELYKEEKAEIVELARLETLAKAKAEAEAAASA